MILLAKYCFSQLGENIFMEGQGQNLTTDVNIPCKQKLVVYGVQIKLVDALNDYNWYDCSHPLEDLLRIGWKCHSYLCHDVSSTSPLSPTCTFIRIKQTLCRNFWRKKEHKLVPGPFNLTFRFIDHVIRILSL